MIKEITKVTTDSKYTCVVHQSVDESALTVTMTSIEPDIFVEDDVSADIALHEALVKACENSNQVQMIALRRSLPAAVSKVEHYNNIIDESELLAQAFIFKRTKRLMPNYVIITADIFPLFSFHRDFKVNSAAQINGPYCCGTYKDMPVIVSPFLNRGEMLWGVNDETTPGVVTFVNTENKVCNKIVNYSNFVMCKLED
jgi:hypothetical protein